MERQQASLTNKAETPAIPRHRPAAKPSAAPDHPLSRLQRGMGNRGMGYWIQTKLEVGPADDAFEREADRVADQVVGGAATVHAAPSAPARPQRKCACGGSTPQKCDQCAEEKMVQTKADGSATISDTAAASVYSFAGGGEPLPTPVRGFFEDRFQHDFAGVRIHRGQQAAESARSIGARAYTFGSDIVFGPGQYAPGSEPGAKLLAHELTHVVQQGAGRPLTGALNASQAGARVQRQMITPIAAGGGYGGLMERDRQNMLVATAPSAGTPIQVCSRPLQSVLGSWFDHAFVVSPPYQYAVITPTCTPTDGGWNNPVLGTVAQKWDNSPDPCGQSPVRCVPCQPKPGVTDVAQCLRDAFTAYNNPSLYKATGPNSNTFAGTLARTCCDNMVPKPSGLGSVPGWDDSPAPARAGTCPPGPSCN